MPSPDADAALANVPQCLMSESLPQSSTNTTTSAPREVSGPARSPTRTSSTSSNENDETAAADDKDDNDDSDEAGSGAAATPAVEILGQNIFVPPPQLEHASWDAWFAYLQEYMAATNQVIRVREVMSCSQRNKRLASSKAARVGEALKLAPESWGTYQRTYICTHGWKARERGSGQRQRRRTRCTECPFRFVVQLVRSNSAWRLAVRCGTFQHNHAIESNALSTTRVLSPTRALDTRAHDEAAEVAASSERYSAVLKALRPITTELAGIENESEFAECLDALVHQWHAIRQRKRKRVADLPFEI